MSEYVALGMPISSQELAFKTEFLHNPPDRGRKSRALRPDLEQKPISVNCRNEAASPFICLQHETVNSELIQAVCASQAGDARSHNYDFSCVPQRRKPI